MKIVSAATIAVVALFALGACSSNPRDHSGAKANLYCGHGVYKSDGGVCP